MIDPDETRVHELFEKALPLSLEDQRRFLDEQCGSDRALRVQVEKLLKWDAAAGPEFLEKSSAGLDATETLRNVIEPSSRSGPDIEGYEILRELHRGGQEKMLPPQHPGRFCAVY